jgi:putative spermidine/putrescine transport system substrate-binding protein
MASGSESHTLLRSPVSRRKVLGGILLGGIGAIAAACSSAPPAPTVVPAPTTAPAAPAAAAPTATTAAAAAPAAAPTATTAAAAAPAAVPTATTAPAAAAAPASGGKVTLSFYSGGDTNVHDLWANSLFPAYTKANPNVDFNLVFAEHGNGDQTTLDRIAAAKQAGKPSGVDIWETGLLQQAGDGGLIAKLSGMDIPNLANVPPDVFAQMNGYGVPYRGSSVVLAYNSKEVTDPPKNLDSLLSWIKSNDGKFTYNPPDTGGSGGAFVTEVLKSGLNPADLKLFQTGYDQTKETQFDKGFGILKDLGPHIYNKGLYPKGNVGVLQALGKGSISAAPVWSDQGLSYLAQKLLPPEVQLMQLDTPFGGGASYIGMVADSQHKPEVLSFFNWLLTGDPQTIVVNQMNGYPGLAWKYMPDPVQQKFASLAKSYDTFSFSSKFSSDVNKQWYEKVAGTPPPASG